MDVEIHRGERDERISTRWFRNKADAGIMCIWRSDVDRSTKRNRVKNLEKKNRKVKTEEEEKKRLKESMWGIMRRNGYRKKNKEGKRKELKGMYEREGRRKGDGMG